MTTNDLDIKLAPVAPDDDEVIALRDAYYVKLNEPVQNRPDAEWVGCYIDKKLAGVFSYMDVIPTGERFILDFYTANDRFGTVAAFSMLKVISSTDAKVVGFVDIRNGRFQNVMEKFGFEKIGYVYRKSYE